MMMPVTPLSISFLGSSGRGFRRRIYTIFDSLRPKFPPCLLCPFKRWMNSNIISSSHHEVSHEITEFLVCCFPFFHRSFWALERHHKKLFSYIPSKSRKVRLESIRSQQSYAAARAMHLGNLIKSYLTLFGVFFRSTFQTINYGDFPR
jgi:hypothetical protein